MPDLKLKWDALGEKTMHEGALVLVGFMWSLSVLTRLFSLFSLFSLWSDWLSSLAIFSENDEDTLQSLPLNVRDQTLMHVWKRIKGRKEKKRKEKETKQNKTKEIKVR